MDKSLLELYDKELPVDGESEDRLKVAGAGESFITKEPLVEGQATADENICPDTVASAEATENSVTSESTGAAENSVTPENTEAAESSAASESTEATESSGYARPDRLSAVEQSVTTLGGAVERLVQSVQEMRESLALLTAPISAVSSSMRGYEEAVKTLRISLAANQRNEQTLHDELEAARKDEHFTVIRPFLEFMVSQHIDLIRSRRNYEKDKETIVQESGEAVYREFLKLHDDFLLSLENQMHIQGVEIVSYLPGTEYLPLEQSIIGFAPTEDPQQGKKIFDAMSCTYKYQNRILRKANVICFKQGG